MELAQDAIRSADLPALEEGWGDSLDRPALVADLRADLRKLREDRDFRRTIGTPEPEGSLARIREVEQRIAELR